jgi:hypothetical protein
MLTHTGPTTQLSEGLLITLHNAGPCIIYSPNYLGCQELMLFFLPAELSGAQLLTTCTGIVI